jgi:hypothetical protein
MSLATRIWLVISIILSIYLVYIVGQASITNGYFGVRYIFPFFVGEVNLNEMSRFITDSGVVSIISWCIWGVLFARSGSARSE